MIQESKNGQKIRADGKRRVELDRLVLEQRDKSGGTSGNEEERLDWMPHFKFYDQSFQAMWTLREESVSERWLKLKSYAWRKITFQILPNYSRKIISMLLELSMLKCFHCHRMGLSRDMVISEFLHWHGNAVASVWRFWKYNNRQRYSWFVL